MPFNNWVVPEVTVAQLTPAFVVRVIVPFEPTAHPVFASANLTAFNNIFVPEVRPVLVTRVSQVASIFPPSPTPTPQPEVKKCRDKMLSGFPEMRVVPLDRKSVV